MKKVVHRKCNKDYYRVLHVPLWIWVFWVLPGQLTQDLFSHGPDKRHWIWLGIVTVACAWRGVVGKLPGAESVPYITHYGEDKVNPWYRVVCYTAAWVDLVAPFVINLTAIVIAALTGKWMIYNLYGKLYYVVVAAIVMATLLNVTPRARQSIRGDGAEKAWFYVAVWVVVPTQIAAWGMWRLGGALGVSGMALNQMRLATFVVVSTIFLTLGFAGKLPRTRRYLAPEWAPSEMQVSEGAQEF